MKRHLLATHFPWGALYFGLSEFAQACLLYKTVQYKPLVPSCLMNRRDPRAL